MSGQSLQSSPTRSFCAFRADRRLYGVDVANLREISTAMAITPVPPAPSVVRGLANLRSRILLILDLRALLGLPPVPCSDESRLIIFKPEIAQDTGLLVDRGGDILAVPQDRIEVIDQRTPASQEPSGSEATPPLVVAVCKLESELLMIIDASRLGDLVGQALNEWRTGRGAGV
jgi:purine-binding chemotaxis protein CheW